MATQTIEYYLEVYEANKSYGGDLTKSKNALEALRMLRLIRARDMGTAGSNLSFSPYDDEIKRLENAVVSLTKSASSRSFTRVRCVQS